MPLARDGCVVPTETLAQLLGGFVRSWQRDRPATGGRFRQRGGASVDPVGPLEWLVAETRQSDPAGRGIPRDTLRNIEGRRHRHTELRIADPLVAAIGCPEAFHDGTLEVLPNPKATQAAQDACCGGCETGLDGSLE